MSNVSKQSREFIRFVCFRKDVDLDFKSRDVFSTLCDQYFLDKSRPSISSLVERTGYRRTTVSACLKSLAKLGIWDGKRPVYVKDVFLEKKDFRDKKWWKGLNSRKVVWRPKVVTQRTGRGDRAWSCTTVSRADRLGDTIWGFVQYTNRRVKVRPIGVSYLRKCLGVDDRSTVQKIINGLIAEGRLERDAKMGLRAIEGKPKATPAIEKPSAEARPALAPFQPVQLPDLNPTTHFEIKDILANSERFYDLHTNLNRAYYGDTKLLNEVVIQIKRTDANLDPHHVWHLYSKVKRERRGF